MRSRFIGRHCQNARQQQVANIMYSTANNIWVEQVICLCLCVCVCMCVCVWVPACQESITVFLFYCPWPFLLVQVCVVVCMQIIAVYVTLTTVQCLSIKIWQWWRISSKQTFTKTYGAQLLTAGWYSQIYITEDKNIQKVVVLAGFKDCWRVNRIPLCVYTNSTEKSDG